MSSRSPALSSSGGQLHAFLLNDDAVDPEVIPPPKSACYAPLVRAQLRWERIKKRPGVMLALEIADWTAFFLKLAWAIYVSLKVSGYYREMERVQDDLTSATQTATQIQSQMLELNSSVAIAEAAFTAELRTLDTGLLVLDAGLQLLNAEVNAAINTSLINQIKEAQAEYRLLTNVTATLAAQVTDARSSLGQLVNTTRSDVAMLQTQVQADEQRFNSTYTDYRARADASALALAASVAADQLAFNASFQSFESQLAGALASVTIRPGKAIFSSPGTFSWSVPAGVTSVFLTACGGGGGASFACGGGGADASIFERVDLAAPGPVPASISLTVASGGSSCPDPACASGSGGASSFGSLRSWPGGGGGVSPPTNAPCTYGAAGGPGGSAATGVLAGRTLLGNWIGIASPGYGGGAYQSGYTAEQGILIIEWF